MRLLAPKRIEKTSGVSDTADCCITDQLSNIVIMASTGDLGEYEYKNDAFEEDGQPMSDQHESAALQGVGSQFLVKCGICMQDIPIQEYKDHAAMCKLSASLKQSDFAIPITHGATRVWKKTKFQGHAAPVRYLEDVEYAINQLSQSPPWSTATSNPCAYRLAINAAAGSTSENNDKSIGGGDDYLRKGGDGEEATILEGRSDGNDPGVGDKLLYLLQRWEVQNVVLVVTSWDDGMKGRLGAARYRIYLEEAKAVLEQCYLQSMQSVDANSNKSSSSMNIVESNPSNSNNIGNSIPSSSVMFPSESTNSQRIVYSGEESSCSKSAMYASGQISSSAGDGSSHNQDNGGRGTTPSQAARKGSNQKHPFKSADFAEAYAKARARAMFQLSRPIKSMNPVIMQADTTENFPGGKLVNGFFVGKKAGRPNHFLNDKGSVPLHGPIKPSGNSRIDGYDGLGQIELPNFSRQELDETRKIIRPNELVHRVFFCVCKILGYEDTSWPGCREMMSSKTFLREIVLLDPSQVPVDEIDCVRNELMDRNFAPERIRRHSLFAATMLAWCIRVVQQFDFITAGIEIPDNIPGQNRGYAEIQKGREVVSVIPRKLTLGQDLQMSRVMAKTPLKKPVTAPLYERNDTGPMKVNVPRLNRKQMLDHRDDKSTSRGHEANSNRPSHSRATSNRSGRTKSGKGSTKRSVRVNSQMTSRSSVHSRNSVRNDDLDKW